MTKNILDKIKENIDELTKTQRKVADYVIKNPFDVAFMTIEELSSLTETSTNTIMRVCFQLKYSGYSDFQKDLRNIIRNKVAPSKRFTKSIKKIKKDNIINRSFEHHMNNMGLIVEQLTLKDIEESVELILSAERIYCAGSRSSYSIAHFIYHGLNRVLGNCEFLFPGNGDLPERVSNIGNKDIVISATLPRYASVTTKIVESAANKNAKIIAITDGYASPIAGYSDVLLQFDPNSLSFHNSVLGGIFIADILITSITLKQPDKVYKRLIDLEKTFEKWHVLDEHTEKHSSKMGKIINNRNIKMRKEENA